MQWIKQTFRPCVAVQSTDNADAVCKRSGLDVVRLLRPFESVPDVHAAISLGPEKTIQVADVSLRFRFLSRINALSAETIIERASGSASEEQAGANSPSPPNGVQQSWGIACKEDVDGFARQTGAGDTTPWFTEYAAELLDVLRGGDCESLDHPMAVLNVVAAGDTDVVAKLTALSALSSLPTVFKRGIADPRLVRFHVLLHDNADPSHRIETTEQVLQDMKRTFGSASCHLLRINSGTDAGEGVLAAPWRSSQHPQQPEGSGLLTVEDARAVANLVASLVKGRLVPHIEDRVTKLSESVQSRRGIKSQLKAWWKRGGNEGAQGAASVGSPKDGYGYDTAFGQQRILADLLLMLGDYDGAASHYKHAAEDFKGERALRQAAAANEMYAIALAAPHLSPSGPPANAKPRSVQRELELFALAFQQHLRADYGDGVRPNQLYALRCAVEALVISGMPTAKTVFTGKTVQTTRPSKEHVDMAAWLVQCLVGLEEFDLAAALLLEQAALCHLLARPCQLRKFSFFLILAGYRFSKAKRKLHTIRCYQSALAVHGGPGWLCAFDHMSVTLTRLYMMIGDAQGALDVFVPLLCHCQQSPDRQRLTLQAFGTCFTNWAASRKVGLDAGANATRLQVGVPVVNDSDLVVSFDEETHIARATQSSSDVHWQAMEHCANAIVANADKALPAREGAILSSPMAPDNASPRGVAREPITVAFAITNPMLCDLQLKGMRLVCEVKVAEQAGNEGDSDPVPDAESLPYRNNPQTQWLYVDALNQLHPELLADTTHAVQVRDVGMGPGQTQRMSLSVVPFAKGEVSVVGVVWDLMCGSTAVPTSHTFKTKGKRLNATREQRKGVVYGVPPNHNIAVLPPMARLSVKVSRSPQACLLGETTAITLRLTNHGTQPLHDLTAHCMPPSTVHIQSIELDDGVAPADAPPSDEAKRAVVRFDRGAVRLCSHAHPEAVEAMPLKLPCLSPGKGVTVRAWVRPIALDDIAVRLLFRYVPHGRKGNAEVVLSERFARVGWGLRVMPSLVVTPSTFRSDTQRQHHVMALKITNSSHNTPVVVRGAAVVSKVWAIERCCNTPPQALPPNNANANDNAVLALGPKQTSMLLFTLAPTFPGEFTNAVVTPRNAREEHELPLAALVLRERDVRVRRATGEQQQQQQQQQQQLVPPNVDVAVTWMANEHAGQTNLFKVPLVVSPRPSSAEARGGRKQSLPVARPPPPPLLNAHPFKCVWKQAAGESAPVVRVEHDFASGMCLVPLTLCLTNASPCDPLRLSIEFVNEMAVVGGDAPPKPCRPSFVWVGATRVFVPDVPPATTRELHTRACFFAPGLYDLNRFCVSVVVGDHTRPVQGDTHCMAQVVQATA